MFDVPADATYVWLGLSLVGLVVLGFAVRVPGAPPPDAAGVAATVDAVAAGGHAATAEHPVAAAELRLGPRRVAARSDGGSAHARFTYGPVTPVREGTALARVLRGTPPSRAFDSVAAFREALRRARDREPTWERVDGPVVVRAVSWEGVDATLVGA